MMNTSTNSIMTSLTPYFLVPSVATKIGAVGWRHSGPGVWDSDVSGRLKSIWVNYNELTTSSLEIIVSKGNHPQMALIQVSELL